MQLFESDESDVVSPLFEWRSHAKSTPWRRTFCLRSILIKYSFNAGDVFYSKANRTLSIHYQQTKVVVLHLSFHWSFLINILLFGRYIYSNAFHRGWYEGRGMEKDREGEGNDSFPKMAKKAWNCVLVSHHTWVAGSLTSGPLLLLLPRASTMSWSAATGTST